MIIYTYRGYANALRHNVIERRKRKTRRLTALKRMRKF